MRQFSILCAVVLLTLPCFALDREAFTFSQYNLKVQIEPEQQRLAAEGTLTLRNDSETPQKSLALQISSSLGWRSIVLDGKPVEFISQTYTSDVDHTGALSEAIVTLPQAIAPHTVVELRVRYEGIIPLDATRLTRIGAPEEAARHTDWDQISEKFSCVRGAGYVTWYPVATEAASLSDGTAVFDTLARWRSRESVAVMSISLANASAGADGSDVLLCDGRQTGGGSSDATQCDYSPLGLVTPDFALAAYRTTGTEALKILSLPPGTTQAEAYVTAAKKVEGFVTNWFGNPHSAVRIAELPDQQASPYESGGVLFTPLGASSDQIEASMVHQLTHASVSSPRMWIQEGLAHFAQALYHDQLDGRRSAIEFMGQHLPALIAAEKQPGDGSLITSPREELYRTKAMYVWWMLHDIVGDSALKKALASYHPEEDKEPSYMQRLLETAARKDLEWFFDAWVYRDRGLPEFHVESIYPHKTMRGTYLVTVSVENQGNAAAEVPVLAHFGTEDAVQRLQVPAKSHASVRIETPSLPDTIVVNDGSVPEADTSNNTFKVPQS